MAAPNVTITLWKQFDITGTMLKKTLWIFMGDKVKSYPKGRFEDTLNCIWSYIVLFYYCFIITYRVYRIPWIVAAETEAALWCTCQGVRNRCQLVFSHTVFDLNLWLTAYAPSPHAPTWPIALCRVRRRRRRKRWKKKEKEKEKEKSKRRRLKDISTV